MKNILKALPSFLLTSAMLVSTMFTPVVLAQNFQQQPEENVEIDTDTLGLQIPDFITEFIQDVQAIAGEIETFLDQQGVEVAQGEIGLPDIESAKIVFAENAELDEMSDLFGTQTGSTFVNQDKLLQQYLRNLSQEFAENSSLSQPGQEKIAQKVETTNEIVQSSIALADDSSNQDVSQNILRNISNQLSLQQQIDSLNILEAQEAKIANSLQIEMSSELLTEMSKSNTLNQRQYTATNKTITNAMPYLMVPTEREVQR
ncbi:MAG: hypothetical protein ACRC1Z_23690 [Waterburya sp.]